MKLRPTHYQKLLYSSHPTYYKAQGFPVFCIFTGAKEFFLMQNDERI